MYFLSISTLSINFSLRCQLFYFVINRNHWSLSSLTFNWFWQLLCILSIQLHHCVFFPWLVFQDTPHKLTNFYFHTMKVSNLSFADHHNPNHFPYACRMAWGRINSIITAKKWQLEIGSVGVVYHTVIHFISHHGRHRTRGRACRRPSCGCLVVGCPFGKRQYNDILWTINTASSSSSTSWSWWTFSSSNKQPKLSVISFTCSESGHRFLPSTHNVRCRILRLFSLLLLVVYWNSKRSRFRCFCATIKHD